MSHFLIFVGVAAILYVGFLVYQKAKAVAPTVEADVAKAEADVKKDLPKV